MTYTVYSTTATTVQEVLVKEDVSDLITNLFPLDTPLQQILEKVPMNGKFKEQPVDTFPTTLINRVSSMFGSGGATAATTSAKPEGATYTDDAEQYPARLISCVSEIQGEQFSVSDTDRALSQYGMADRFAYQALKTTEAVVNQFELSFWLSPGTVPGGADLDSGGGTYWAKQTQGLVHWIVKSGLQRSIIGLGIASFTDGHGNEFGTNSPALNTGASSWAYNAGGLALDQAMFKQNLMAQWYNITGRQGGAVGFTGGTIKNLFSQFGLSANGPINERTIEAAAKRVTDTVDWYETDYGVVSINLCRYLDISGQSQTVTQSTGSVVMPWNEILVFIKPEYFKIGVTRPVHMSPLGKAGDFERGLVRGEQGLMCMNPQAGAAIINCVP